MSAVWILFELLGFLLETFQIDDFRFQIQALPIFSFGFPASFSVFKLQSEIINLQFSSRPWHAHVGPSTMVGRFEGNHNEENVMQRKASAVWKGGLKDGKGSLSAPGGVLNNTQYSFATRFENAAGTNPEELIAAAHAGCFSMALSAQLGGANLTPESISTNVTLSLDKLDSGWTITASHIDVVGKVPGADAATFQKYAEAAEKGCPVSKVLNAKITMTAKLE